MFNYAVKSTGKPANHRLVVRDTANKKAKADVPVHEDGDEEVRCNDAPDIDGFSGMPDLSIYRAVDSESYEIKRKSSTITQQQSASPESDASRGATSPQPTTPAKFDTLLGPIPVSEPSSFGTRRTSVFKDLMAGTTSVRGRRVEGGAEV